MQQAPPMLSLYQRIADITRRMLACAQQGDWEQVTVLAPQYHQAVEGLRALGTPSRAELTERRALLTEILENDAAIRRLASPELDRLGLLITNLQRQRNVLQTYYTPQA